ncbi:hypothetical protein BH09ACT7_BH09ACT7_05000 [soil metagenome]
MLSRSALRGLPDPEPLIGEVLDQGTVALLYGMWGLGKSFIALDWAASVATGRSWQGRTTETRRVLYVAAEGAFGLKTRVDAWERGWKKEIPDGTLDVLDRPVNLSQFSEVRELAALIAWAGYGFVILDTLARCMVGADENSAKDSGVVVDALNRLREQTPGGRGVVLGVHHTGKDGRTLRGSSAFEAGADTVYSVTKDADSGALIVNREKRKDGPPVDRHELRIDAVPGTDSAVMSSGNLSTWGVDKTERAARLLSTFVHHFVHTGATKADLRKVADMADATFFRATSDLLKSGDLVNTGTDKRPFYKVRGR